jgi:hypothetical protein
VGKKGRVDREKDREREKAREAGITRCASSSAQSGPTKSRQRRLLYTPTSFPELLGSRDARRGPVRCWCWLDRSLDSRLPGAALAGAPARERERDATAMDRAALTVGPGMDMPIMHDGDRYELVRDIGSGNFGVARLMRNRADGQLVAVKYIDRGEKVGHSGLRYCLPLCLLGSLAPTSSTNQPLAD